MLSKFLKAVPWYRIAGGITSLSSKLTLIECPWTALILVLSSLKLYLFLLFLFTILSNVLKSISLPDLLIFFINSLTLAQPFLSNFKF